ncbi:MAG: 4-hydroxy-2-oxoglutarate aldolase [Clostridiales bacterium]|jgi:4-hydroxy-2-oxoglutarate aldolase|nr:4-hydroxy-2-oxoglutarate aldolase [Clostridiales bacterium]MDK2932779.1 4-hydroxy-2-oxoglutarate aldolase [Clostridiales bacterium]
MKERLRGVFAPITTPFEADGKVAYDALKSNMEKYAASPIHGYLALGSNGENKSLTNEEKEKVLKIIVDYKAPQQIVMAGCIFESTIETIDFAKRAEQMGADFITMLPPSYFKKQMTDAVLIKYFTDIADAVSIPCLVYNAPQFSGGITLSPALIKEVSKHPNIVGMKDSSTGNIDKYLMAAEESFAVMAGSANFFFNALLMGATGGVISLANAFPDITVALYKATYQLDIQKAIALNKKILRANKAVSGKGGVAAVKAAMDLAGFYGGDPRLPLLPMDKEDIEEMKKTLIKEGIL